MTPQPALVLDRVLRVLQPLVRLLLRHGVTYPVFAAALKRVFLNAAQAELDARSMARTDSALTLLSGVHRRDVRELTRGARAVPHEVPAPRSGLGLATEVVARWLHDPAWPGPRAGDGTRTLPRGGERGFDALVHGLSSDVRPRAVLDELLRLGVVREDGEGVHLAVSGLVPRAGFDALVHSLSSDVRPRAVLDELLRLGVVREDGEGVHLAVSGLVPRAGFDEMTWLFAQNLHDHAAAAVANLQGTHEARGVQHERDFLEQAVFVDEIGAASAVELQRAAVAAWKQAFATVMDTARARLDADAKQLPPAARRHRARFGVYFYSEEEPT
jgi:hypothetical protein